MKKPLGFGARSCDNLWKCVGLPKRRRRPGLLPALPMLTDSAGLPAQGLERLHVGSLPALGTLHDVELHGLTFLQALETI